MYITFIFKLSNRLGQTYYGKFHTDNISPNHSGLDEVIRPYLLHGIREYIKQEQKHKPEEVEFNQKVHIGIMSVSNDTYISIHSSHEEKRVFDFYCQKFTINHITSLEMYMFGKLIEN